MTTPLDRSAPAGGPGQTPTSADQAPTPWAPATVPGPQGASAPQGVPVPQAYPVGYGPATSSTPRWTGQSQLPAPQPLSGQPPVAAQRVSVAPSPPAIVTEVPASQPKRRSRSADISLLLAAFVAVGGVAFAIGRMSSPEAATTPADFGLASSVMAAQGGFPGARDGFPDSLRDAVTNDTVDGDAATDGGAVDDSTSAEIASAPSLPADQEVATGDDGSTQAGDANVADTEQQGMGAAPQGGFGAGGRGAGFPGGGFGRGLTGTVTAMEDGSLTLATEDGSTMTVATDDATSWVVETPIEPADVAVGAEVSVQLSFGGMPGQDQGEAQSAQVAQQVTLVTDSAE